MPVNRNKCRADGTLRPSVRRYRARKRKAKNAGKRGEWLAQFAPGDRERFFNHVVLKDAVFLSGFAKATGLERTEAAALLERTASERRWRKLRTIDGTVVGIAPPRSVRHRDAWVVMAGDTPYASRPTRAEAEAVMEEQREVAEKFGPVRVEHRVIDLAAVSEAGRSEPVPSLGGVDGAVTASTMPASPTAPRIHAPER
jgi:hypothetical protein